jgi:ribosomal-protein-alanine N-acetyltransferase
MTWEPLNTIEETHPFTDEALDLWEKGEKFVWTIEGKDNGQFIGRVEVKRAHELPGNTWGLGYWTHPMQQGKGYATEAAKEAIRFAFEELGADSIVSSHHDWNDASGRVLTKIGMKHTGFSEGRVSKKGAPVRSAEFWLDRKDWDSGR